MQDTAFVVWQNISGTGLLAALYLCALVFLFFKEQETYKRILFLYLPAFWIGILFLPMTYSLVAEVIDEELYYRFFWMLPMTMVIGYTLVQVYRLYQGRFQKLLAVALALLVVVCGDFVYNNWRYSVAENAYHVPQQVVEICDVIHAEGREVMAVFPMELLQYIRQYDSTICMPYGRDVLVDHWAVKHPLYDQMEAEVPDGESLGREAAFYDCAYIVLKETDRVSQGLAKSGYVLLETRSEYQIYFNEEIFSAIYK